MKKVDSVLIDLFNDYIPILKDNLVKLRKSQGGGTDLDAVIKTLGRKVTPKNIIALNEAILRGETMLTEANIELPRTALLRSAIKEDLKQLSEDIVHLYLDCIKFNPKINEFYLKIRDEFSNLNCESADFVIDQINGNSLLEAEHKETLVEKIFKIFKP